MLLCKPFAQLIFDTFSVSDRLMEIFSKQDHRFQKIDVLQLRGCKEEERSSSLDEDETEPPQIKEEEEELCCSQEEEQQLLKQEIKSECEEILVIQYEDLSVKNICKEETDDEQLLWKQERSSSLDEEDPELPLIKEEEEEEQFINEEGDQLELKQENDAFLVTEDDQENMDSNPEPSENPVLGANSQIRNFGHFKLFGKASTLERHCQRNTEENSVQCSVCGKTTHSLGKQSQRKQLDVIHSDVTLGLCEACRNRLDQGDAVTVQLDERSHSCETCGKVFTRRGSLITHMRIHTAKVLERILLSHLRSLVKPSLDPLQFAYQPRLGMEDAVIHLLQRAHSHLDGGGGHCEGHIL
ncbi:uncharacterized protein LOC105356154 isoform X10 [Oryzias latipes]